MPYAAMVPALALIALLGLALPTGAAPARIAIDFDDSTQGLELQTAAMRVQMPGSWG